jgi:ribonuclease HI
VNDVAPEMMETVRFGIEAETFLESRIGRYLVNRSKEEVAAALEGLKKVDPCDHQQIVALQNVVYRAESIEAWLAEAIQEGWNTENNIRRMEE